MGCHHQAGWLPGGWAGALRFAGHPFQLSRLLSALRLPLSDNKITIQTSSYLSVTCLGSKGWDGEGRRLRDSSTSWTQGHWAQNSRKRGEAGGSTDPASGLTGMTVSLPLTLSAPFELIWCQVQMQSTNHSGKQG